MLTVSGIAIGPMHRKHFIWYETFIYHAGALEVREGDLWISLGLGGSTMDCSVYSTGDPLDITWIRKGSVTHLRIDSSD